MKKRFLVLLAKEQSLFDDLIEHGGADIVILTDKHMAQSIKIAFKEQHYIGMVAATILEKGFPVTLEYAERWPSLVGSTPDVNVEVLMANLLDCIREAGYEPLISASWISVPKFA